MQVFNLFLKVPLIFYFVLYQYYISVDLYHTMTKYGINSLQWHHNERDGVSEANHQPHDCLLNGLFRHRWKKTPKLRVTGLGAGNSPLTGEFPAQMASNAENISIWSRHHVQADIKALMAQWIGTYY